MRLYYRPGEGLTLVLPTRVSAKRGQQFVEQSRDWVAAQHARFGAEVRRVERERDTLPGELNLPALNERWTIRYRRTAASTVRAVGGADGEVVVSGAIDDVAACHAALRRWLLRHAEAAMRPALDALSRKTGLVFSTLKIRTQRARWGSCNSRGAISLNGKLLFVSPPQLDYVLAHELVHTREMNHSARFWARLEAIVPNARRLDRSLRRGWTMVQGWV